MRAHAHLALVQTHTLTTYAYRNSTGIRNKLGDMEDIRELEAFDMWVWMDTITWEYNKDKNEKIFINTKIIIKILVLHLWLIKESSDANCFLGKIRFY